MMLDHKVAFDNLLTALIRNKINSLRFIFAITMFMLVMITLVCAFILLVVIPLNPAAPADQALQLLSLPVVGLLVTTYIAGFNVLKGKNFENFNFLENFWVILGTQKLFHSYSDYNEMCDHQVALIDGLTHSKFYFVDLSIRKSYNKSGAFMAASIYPDKKTATHAKLLS